MIRGLVDKLKSKYFHSLPSFIQHDYKDCGPTCLRMICSYYGLDYSLDYLRNKAHITKEGVSLLGLSEAAETIGLHTRGVSLTFDSLRECELPCIVHWNQVHFVVIYKIAKKFIYIADPAVGKVKLTIKEFCQCWHSISDEDDDLGIVLLLKPTPSFWGCIKKMKPIKKRSFSFLYSYIKPYKKLILQLIIGLIIVCSVQVLLPFLTQSIVDKGIHNKDINYIYLILIAQLVLIISIASFEFIRGWILLYMGTQVNVSLISDFLTKLMKLPMKYFDTKLMGDLLQRIQDHDRIQKYLTNSTLNILFSTINIIVFSIVLLFYSYQIFLIFFLGNVIYFFWIWIFMGRREQLDHKSFTLHSLNQNSLIQLITGMQDIKLTTSEFQKRSSWEQIQSKLFRIRIKSLALSQYQESGALIINQTKNLVVTAIVAKFVVENQMTLGMMIAVQYIIGQLNSPINQMILFLRQTQDARLSLERLSDIQNQENEENENDSLIKSIPHIQNIILKDIVFYYDTTSIGKPIINNVSLTIPRGKQTAIVGMSGSGKTTLLRLILGYYKLESGGIFLDDDCLDNYSIREWRKQCGVVMQDSFIFSDTVANNIAIGDESINDVKLNNAIISANLKDFIDELPSGYNTLIGNDGMGLSQGQKQRILIARAVYKNPDFVLFDEATNSLDANNEKVILNNLKSFFKNRTSIIVAHRLSTVQDADQIVVLEKGEIVEIGTHLELSKKKGSYYQLVKNQLEL